MKSGNWLFLGVVVFVVVAVVSASAQSFLDEPGIPAFTTAFPVENGFINLANGNLHLEFPIATYSQRGNIKAMNARLVYDSRFWIYDNSAEDPQGWQPSAFIGTSAPLGGGWRFVTGGQMGNYGSSHSLKLCGQDIFEDVYTNFFYQEPDGTTHRMGRLKIVNAPAICRSSIPSGTAYATDGSGYKLVINNFQSKVYAPDGSIIDFALNNSQQSVKDANGNFFTETFDHVVDTLGREPVVMSFSGNTTDPVSQVFLDYLNTQGTRSRVTVTRNLVNVATQFGTGGDYTGTLPVIQSILLPNGTSYQFQYDSYGQITNMFLPTGGQVAYGYTNPTSPHLTNRWITSRTVDGNTWTFTPAFVCTTASCDAPGDGQTVTVTTPPYNDGNITANDNHVYLFLYVGGGAWPTQIQYFRGPVSGMPLVTKNIDYSSTNTTTACPPSVFMGGFTAPTREILTWPTATGTLSKKTEYCYDGLANLTAARQWDYQPNGSFAATPDREIDKTYVSDAAYVNANLIKLPASETIIGADGGIKAQTLYSYDNTAVLADLGGVTQHDGNYSTAYTTRGNLTQVQHLLNPGNTFITTATNTYDDLGNLRQTTDALGHSTTFDYSNDFPDWSCLIVNSAPQVWVTQTTNALGQSTQTQYFGCTGQPVWTRDQNDINANRVNASYTYDTMNRVTQVDYANGGQSTYFYNDDLTAFPMIYVRETTKIDSSNVTRSWTGFDGLGRKARFGKDNGEGTSNMFDMSDTCYDALGRVSTQNYPFQGAGWLPNPINCSASTGDTFTYDALGRTTQVTHSDGSHVNTDFSQFPVVTVTDEAGKQRRNKTDGFGRLVAVWEPDASRNFNYETDYQYDTLGNLIRVDQKGADSDSANWRTRTFAYDSLSRLLSATNPESGTITYAYDNAGNLTSKTAPAPNQTGGATVTTSYSYDVLNRLTTRTFSDNSHSATYIYDQTPLWGVNVQNPVGRLVGTYGVLGSLTTLDGSSGGGGVGSVFSYDIMGRLIQDIQFNQHVLPWAPLQTFNYSYNLDGSLKTLQYPSGRTITYSYNVGQRPVSAVDVGNGINYYAAAHYTAFGASASMVYGATLTFAGITWNNTFNSRMQPVFLTATTPSSTVFSLGYDFHLNGDDNGNVYAVNNNKITDHGRDQSFTYDQLNRLLTAQSAATSGPNCWGESFGYDPWANMTSRNVTKCSAEGSVPSVNTKNQMNGNSYDAAGNLLTGGYTYNSENQLIASPGVAYDYNVDGERVQKSDGTLYWHGLGGQVLEETNLSGTLKEEYIFFGGKRIARRDPSGAVHYYFADHLGSTDIVTNASGIVEEEREFYPFGGERIITDSGIGNNYKFTGKERDSETGLDEFGARYYSSAFGRFTIPDWAATPTTVPYANFGNPQSLNLYGYTKNNPTTFRDPDGHCDVEGKHHGGVWCVLHTLGFIVTKKEREAEIHEAAEGWRQLFARRGVKVYQGDVQLDLNKLSDGQVLHIGAQYFQAYYDSDEGEVNTYTPSAAAVAATAQLFADAAQIAGGHAWSKHQGEFPGWTQKDFEQKIGETVQNAKGANVKQLSGGRTAYWNDREQMVVIHDPHSPDGGTAFRPTNGIAYFNGLH